MDIGKKIQTKINKIGKKHNLKLMVLYGSHVNGKTHHESDLDIGLLFKNKPESYTELLSIQDELKKVFPGYELDVKYLHDSPPLFFFEAVYKGKLLYGSSYDYAKACASAFKQYIDSKPLRDLRDFMINKRQKSYA